jgi:hypothetical protein
MNEITLISCECSLGHFQKSIYMKEGLQDQYAEPCGYDMDTYQLHLVFITLAYAVHYCK